MLDLSNAKPILFNTEMVKAIIDGRKTVTRRLIKPHPTGKWAELAEQGGVRFKTKYKIGDILYVRETWFYESHMEECHDISRYVYRESSPEYPVNVGAGKHGWKPSIFMPKEAARIFLRVTDVKVERLHDISEEQAKKEGVAYPTGLQNWVSRFKLLWNSTIKKSDLDRYGWNANPWVFVYEFEIIILKG